MTDGSISQAPYPILGLAQPGGANGPLENTGWAGGLILRASGDGTVANARTIVNQQYPQSYIDISRCGGVGLYINPTYGSLTNMSVSWEFASSDESGFLVCHNAHWSVTNGTIAPNTTLDEAVLTLTAATDDQQYYFAIPNPGAKFIRFYTQSTGTVTSSSITIATTGIMHACSYKMNLGL